APNSGQPPSSTKASILGLAVRMSVIARTPAGPSSFVNTGQPPTSVHPPSPLSLSRPFWPDRASRVPEARRRILSAAALPSIRQTVPPLGLAFFTYSPSR